MGIPSPGLGMVGQEWPDKALRFKEHVPSDPRLKPRLGAAAEAALSPVYGPSPSREFTRARRAALDVSLKA